MNAALHLHKLLASLLSCLDLILSCLNPLGNYYLMKKYAQVRTSCPPRPRQAVCFLVCKQIGVFLSSWVWPLARLLPRGGDMACCASGHRHEDVIGGEGDGKERKAKSARAPCGGDGDSSLRRLSPPTPRKQ